MKLIKGDGECNWLGFTVAKATRSNCGRCEMAMIGYGEPLCKACSAFWMEWIVENVAKLMGKR